MDQVGRDDPIAPTNPYDAILSTACHFQNIGKSNLALLLVMPDHLHLIANIVSGAMGSSRPTGIAPDEFKNSNSELQLLSKTPFYDFNFDLQLSTLRLNE